MNRNTISILTAIALLLSLQFARAGSATWTLNPASGDWNTAANWTPATVPNSVSDTATFDLSSTTAISLSSGVLLSKIIFNPGASAYTITASHIASLDISGAGITNSSSASQNFVIANFTMATFRHSASAGNQTAFTVTGDTVDTQGHAFITFSGTSSAGSASFTINGGQSVGTGGSVIFAQTATAADGTFVINGATNGAAEGGRLTFGGPGDPSAGNGVFTVNGGEAGSGTGGRIDFAFASGAQGLFTVNGGLGADAAPGIVSIGNGATAGNATLIANAGQDGGLGGHLEFLYGSTADQARVELLGNADLDLSAHFSPGLTVGSIEGSGSVLLGANALTVGETNRNTAFSGIISGTGSVIKTGTGKLTLSGASTYTGGTTVEEGTILITNRTGSATGIGAVGVNAGTLAGTGRTAGAVTIGTATSAATLAPGIGTRHGRLTFSKTLTFNALANYKVDFNSTARTVDSVTAKGVTITSGATITIDDFGSGTFSAGSTFTIINNTAATPIAGTFSNLPEGSILTVGNNTYKAIYEGGTGNDLTLTVQ